MASNKRNHVDPEEFRFPDQVIHESPLVPEMETRLMP